MSRLDLSRPEVSPGYEVLKCNDSWLPRREGQRNWSCVHVCHRRAGKQQILGTVDGKVLGLNMRVAQVKKSLTSVCDMFAAGHRVVFDFDSNNRDLSHAENKLTGERTYFKERNRVWELEVNIILKAETEDILTKMQEQNVEELCPFEGQVLWPSRRHGGGDSAPRSACRS